MKKKYKKTMKRVKKVLDKRRADYKEKLDNDFQKAVLAALKALEQHGNDELYSARGIEIRYEITEGKISRSASAYWRKLSNDLVKITLKECDFGFYADVYKAFVEFNRDLDMLGMRIVKPELPARDCSHAIISYQVYFD